MIEDGIIYFADAIILSADVIIVMEDDIIYFADAVILSADVIIVIEDGIVYFVYLLDFLFLLAFGIYFLRSKLLPG